MGCKVSYNVCWLVQCFVCKPYGCNKDNDDVPNNWCLNSWSLYIQGRWKSLHQRITVQMTHLLHIVRHVLFPKFAEHTLSGPNCHTTSFCVELVSSVCPNKALLWQNAVLYALGKKFEGWRFRILHQKHFHMQSQAERRCLILKNCWFLLVMKSQRI